MSDGDKTPEPAPTPPADTAEPPPADAPEPPPADAPEAPPADAPEAPSADAAESPPADTAEPPPADAPEAPPADAAEPPPDPGPPGPKMVRQVVCSYRLGWLPGDWLQTWRRLDRVFAGAELQVKATLAPLENLPTDTDILVVPPDLREAAREAAPPGTPILVTPASAAGGAFAELISRLQAGTEFTAERVEPKIAN